MALARAYITGLLSGDCLSHRALGFDGAVESPRARAWSEVPLGWRDRAGLGGQEVGSSGFTCPPLPGTDCRLRTRVRQDPEEGLGSGQLCHWFALNLNPSFLFPERG